MRYDHELWDSVLKILQHGKERLLAKGNGTMCAEVDRVYQSAINTFSMPLNQLAWALHFICTEQGVLPPIGLDKLNDDEKRAVEDKDLQATSTENAFKSIRLAHKRLVKAEKMKPVTDAQKLVDEAEALRAEKKRLADEAERERNKPAREKDEADNALRDARKGLKQAEKEIGV